MSNMTKERLRERAREKVKSLEFAVTQTAFADTRAELEEELELASIALASLEAEPVVYMWDSERKDIDAPGYYRPEHLVFAESSVKQWGGRVVPLYTAPPAPVAVPDEAISRAVDEVMATYAGSADECRNLVRKHIEDACCAAMPQGADGNSPVIPDGWVACSERMPDIGTEIFYFCQDDGLRDCGIVSSSNFSGRGDAQLYVHAEGYDLRFGVDITHWMPLPAAPQQEVTQALAKGMERYGDAMQELSKKEVK